MCEYKCQSCGKFIKNIEGITTLNGLWICDKDSCRTLDNENQATEMTWLEEIIGNVEEIMETPYVVRKEKAEEVGIDLIMTGKVDFLLRKINSLEEQNNRYRAALEFYAISGQGIGETKHGEVARKALEESK